MLFDDADDVDAEGDDEMDVFMLLLRLEARPRPACIELAVVVVVANVAAVDESIIMFIFTTLRRLVRCSCCGRFGMVDDDDDDDDFLSVDVDFDSNIDEADVTRVSSLGAA